MSDGTYGERPSRLGGGTVVWARTARAEPGEARVLPDGCMDLLWNGERLLVAGPDTRAHLATEEPGARWAGLRFAPGVAPAVLGVPAHELRDLRVELEQLWPRREVRALAGRVARAADAGAALEDIARAREVAAPDPLCAAALAALRAGRPVADAARAGAVSERQLHRRALVAFGYGPKTLARILRMQSAVRLAHEGRTFAETAALTGYADQAHLAREVRALAGVPLTRLLRG